MILGLGIDLVSLPEFEAQAGAPGARFLESILTPRELRRVRARAAATSAPGVENPTALARHAGGRWAAKEAFIKAWSQALRGSPPLLNPDGVDWRLIEVVDDRWGRPALDVHGRIADAVAASLEEGLGIGADRWRLHLSISHDGPFAVAEVILEGLDSGQ